MLDAGLPDAQPPSVQTQDVATIVERSRTTRPVRAQISAKPLTHRKLPTSSRAHLQIARHPAWIASLNSALKSACESLSKEIGQQVSISASLETNALRLLECASHFACFAIFDLLAVQSKAVLEIEPLLLGNLFGAIGGRSNGMVLRLLPVEEAALAWTLLLSLQSFRSQTELDATLRPHLSEMVCSRSTLFEIVDGRINNLCVNLEFKVGEKLSRARLFVPTAAAQSACQTSPMALWPTACTEIETAQVTFRVSTNTALLPRSDVAELAVGDVIVIDGAQWVNQVPNFSTTLNSGLIKMNGHFTEQGFLLTHVRKIPLCLESRMTDTLPLCSDLPVELEIELARVPISVRELGKIQVGGLIPLHINLQSLVTLRLGDKSIARGTLVDIEGEVGVRIVEMID